MPVEMEALTIDKICTPLGPVELNLEKYPHLKNLVLADMYPHGSVDIDVLIGADFYFSFITGNCIKGETLNSMALNLRQKSSFVFNIQVLFANVMIKI